MLFNKILEERRSVREYKSKKVDDNTLKRLMDMAYEIQEGYGNDKIKFILFEDGEKIYNSLKGAGGYSGVMIESPHYIALQTDDEAPETLINGAYSMESLITKAFQLDLGTCWINLKEASKDAVNSLAIENGKHINYLISLGYPKDKTPFNPIPSSSRLSIEEIVYDEEWGKKIDLDILEGRGLRDIFYYARFAPSDMNSQPWRFIVKKDYIQLAILNPEDKEHFTDAGIIMYYFERMSHDSGINGKWKVMDHMVHNHDKNYTIVSAFKI